MSSPKLRMPRHVPLPTALDPAACDDCALVPGSLQRVRQMQAQRKQGWSLDEIALRFGVSRERVRQILRAHGGPDPQSITDARRRRAEVQAEDRVDELLALWRTGEQPRSAADKLGLQAAACRSTIDRFATDVDRAARKASMAGARRVQTYSDRDIILALTSVATRVGRVPSAKEYAAHARALNYPSLPTVLNRMGGWAHALNAAGMQPLSAPARRRKRRWTEESCWTALRSVVEELGEIPTVLAYERHAAGRPELPSAATLRNRLGRWSAITSQLAAQRELARAMQTETQTVSVGAA
ncbi:MAG TPA: sigma factor-like helix-turn-helix DNA-binding protein [Solirubrobacteraceae bacterium]|nr:sigma factor-like helix-turn-helix DNA-binding protein [Solirubrobacteraceae bacterium]